MIDNLHETTPTPTQLPGMQEAIADPRGIGGIPPGPMEADNACDMDRHPG
jgi:hypothetical protein